MCLRRKILKHTNRKTASATSTASRNRSGILYAKITGSGISPDPVIIVILGVIRKILIMNIFVIAAL